MQLKVSWNGVQGAVPLIVSCQHILSEKINGDPQFLTFKGINDYH